MYMKFSCTRDNLHRALTITGHLTTKNVNLPILQNILIEAKAGGIKFTSTNLEIGINYSVRGKVEQEGSSTIPSKLFFDYVSLLPMETVSLEEAAGVFHVSCGNNTTKINGIDAADFPVVPTISNEEGFLFPIEAFREALSHVLFCVASNDSRPELTGVCVNLEPSEQGVQITLASTDSYRLSERKIMIKGTIKETIRLILPARTLSELNRILSVFRDDVEAPTEVLMVFSQGQVVFRVAGVELVSRVIEGVYPDYTQIIPQTFQTETLIDREDFIRAIKAASLFSKQGLFDVNLEFDPQEGCICVKANDAVRGGNVVQCQAQVAGQANQVSVNYRYLLDGLSSMKTQKIRFKLIDAANPCLVEPEDPERTHLYIVMPIKQ